LACGAALLGIPFCTASGETADLAKWLDSPIRYIATTPEVKVFKGLETDAARAAFIESFWSRRDPNPDTLVNEYRQLFWERVKYANETFLDSSAPGWKTDRGKIYILYGAPTRIENDLDADTKGSEGAGRGLIRWTYEGSERGRKDINPVVVIVPFVRNVSGEYRLSYDPKLMSEFYTWDDIESRSAFESVLQSEFSYSTRSPLSAMLDMGLMQTVPQQEEVLLARVDTVEVYDEQALPVAVQRYRHPDGQDTVLILTLSVPEIAGESRAAILARLVPQGAPEATPKLLGEDSFRFDGEGPARRAQGRMVVSPGTYELTVLLVRPGTSNSAIHRSTVVIPAQGDPALELSDVTLASRLEPVRYASLASYSEPYLVGGFHVVPQVSDHLRRGDELSLFYEVYGGSRPYNVTYRLEIRKDSEWKPLGSPILHEGAEGAQGWSVPTTDAWPLGQYRVVIAVRDAQGSTSTAEVGFDLTTDGAS
jgi:GWxTD domain-containing protein